MRGWRVGRGWRWAWLHYRSGRGLGWTLAGAGAAFVLAGRALARSPEAAGRVYLALAILLPLALAVRSVSRDRRASRWLLLFQAPVTPVGHYARMLALLLLLCWAVLTGGTILVSGAAAIAGHAASALLPLLVAALVWSGVLALVAFAASALLPRGDGALVALYVLASFLQVALLDDLGIEHPRVRRMVSWGLVPLDAMAGVWRTLVGVDTSASPSDWARIGLFCAAWLCLGAAALARLGRAEMPLREG